MATREQSASHAVPAKRLARRTPRKIVKLYEPEQTPLLPTPAPLPAPITEGQPSATVPISKGPCLEDWTVDDVYNWLSSQSKSIASAAKDFEVDGAVLAKMDVDAWAELGVTSPMERCKLLTDLGKAAATGEVPSSQPRLSEPSMPKNGDAQKTYEILCRCTIQNLNIVSLEKGEFSARLKFEAQWEDRCEAIKRLARDTEDSKALDELIDHSRSSYNAFKLKRQGKGVSDPPFAPRIQFMNCVEKKNEESWYSLKGWKAGQPIVKWYCFFDGTFSMRNMTLRKFPLDEQMLTIEVQTGCHLPGEGAHVHASNGEDSKLPTVFLSGHPEESDKRSIVAQGTISFSVKNQYRLSKAVYFDKDKSHPSDSSSGYVYSRLDISMHVRRRSFYYLLNIIFPCFMITSSLLASYGLEATDSTRLEVSITVLLALTTFKFVLAGTLPQVNYATLFDYYVLSAFVFAFAIICVQLLTFLDVYEEVPFSLTLPYPYPLVVGFFVWFGYHLFILLIYLVVYLRRHCVPPERRTINSTSWANWCDKEARVGKDGVHRVAEKQPALRKQDV